jgi:hypothetical protein
MKNTILLVALVVSTFSLLSISHAEAATRVGGYFKKSGTYVSSHYRSTSDHYKFNNYSFSGNYNPYTGKKGYLKRWW